MAATSHLRWEVPKGKGRNWGCAVQEMSRDNVQGQIDVHLSINQSLNRTVHAESKTSQVSSELSNA